MIEASELRIGNWVIYNDTYLQIIGLDNRNDAQLYFALFSEGGTWVSSLEPIPLSPERLMNAGFKESNTLSVQGTESYEKDGFVISFEGKEFVFDTGTHKVIIPSLHTLQNLYYYINGKELAF